MSAAVSVVLATRDRPEMAREAVAAIRAALRPGDECIVVDSASADAGDVARAVGEGVRLIRLDVTGTSRARNAGWRAAANPVVAFTDDDCAVPSDWTARVAMVFADPSIAFVTGRVVGDRDAALGVATIGGDEPRRFVGAQDPTGSGSGANMAFTKEALEAVGGFDESTGPGTALRAAEDHDLIWRTLRSGRSGVYEPTIVVTHRLWRGRFRSVGRTYEYGIGAGALAVKAIRSGDREGWRYLRARLWRDGLVAGAKSLGKGHESAAAAAVSGAAGAIVGAARASFRRVEEGMFRPRKPSGKRLRRVPGG